MTGVYRIGKLRTDEMNWYSRFLLAKGFLILYGIFATIGFLREGEDKLSTFLILTVVFGIVIALTFIVGLFTNNPLDNTVIEITEDGLIRRGENLLTVRFKFNEIDKIIDKGNGTILLKKGLGSRIGLYFNKFALINEFGILFIPTNIDQYEKIVSYIKQKSR
jgi:hypothetical protein